MEYNVNITQTPLTEDLVKSLSREEKNEVFKYLEGVQFIKNLSSPNRRRIKDMPKDDEGKVIVDLTNPHILEDMDYFRQPAIHFTEHQTYTNLYPNRNPNSEYQQFWKEEARRCREGLVREDGEWIPGFFYYYLNYSPIRKTEVIQGRMAHRKTFFPDLYDGDYLYYHYLDKARKDGRHGSVLKRRGCGASFKGAAKLGRNTVLGEVSFNSVLKHPTVSYAIANEKEYLSKDGILNKYIDNLNWCSSHTPWPRIRDLKNSMNEMHWKMGYLDKDTGVERGSGNEVMGVTLKNDANKARGKRGQTVIWEESGKFKDLLTAWNIARESIEEGDYSFGLMVAYGTGGSSGSDFTALEEMFYNPLGYNMYPIQNVYDLDVSEDSTCSFFFGAYLNRKGYYDKNGNSDVIGATIAVVKDRLVVKYNSNDPNALSQRKAEAPMVPQEAVMRIGQSMFPTTDIREQLSYIKTDLRKFVAPHYVGKIIMNNEGNVEWRNEHLYPIREYPLLNTMDKYGAIEIFQMPIRTSDGTIPSRRYISGLDGYDDDHSTTNSLGSIFILDTWTDRIVAEYTGRPRTANEFYEIARRLFMLYNATCNYENDKKGLYAYFYNKNSLHLLCDNPQILEDKNLANIRENYGNKKKGTNSSTAINHWARQLQADWLIEDAWNTGGEDDEGNIIPPKMNLQMVRSIAYLEELSKWNPDGNFDRISAMGMLMIYREEIARTNTKGREQKKKTITSDDFFDRHLGEKTKDIYDTLNTFSFSYNN